MKPTPGVGMIAAVLSAAWAWSAVVPPSPPGPTPPPSIVLNRAQILDGETMRENKKMRAGKDYVLRIETSGLSHVRNYATLYYGRFNHKTPLAPLLQFRPDPSQSTDAYLAANPAADLEVPFTLPDAAFHYDRGVLRLEVGYKRLGSDSALSFVNYYEVDDLDTDAALAVNDGSPLKTVYPSIGHVGDAKTDAEIDELLEELRSRFLLATKGYVAMDFTYHGRASWPPDGFVSSSTVHDYVSWWNGLSHDLSGTSLLPLDPGDPQDLEMIKQAWYSDGRLPLLRSDASALLGGHKSIMLLEAPYGGVAPAWYCYSTLYTAAAFHEEANGGTQWGIHEDFGWLEPQRQHSMTLHEYGHTQTLGHPGPTYLPSFASWTVSSQSIDYFSGLMHQGGQNGYPALRFYLDSDIAKLTPLSEPTLAIPDVTPIGDPVSASVWTLKGKKEPGAALVINGQEVIPVDDAASSWSVPVSLSVGLNRLHVAQRVVVDGIVRESHPHVLETTRLGAPILPLSPQVQFTSLNPASLQVALGKKLSFTLDAKAAFGVQEIAWWVEKADPGYKLVRNMSNSRKVYGSVTALHTYQVTFDQPGTYRVRARAMTQTQTSPLAEIYVTVDPLM